MTAPSFQKDIKPIFAKYVDDMKKIPLATPSGTRILHLGDYESVKCFAQQIQLAIHGYDFYRGTNPPKLRDGATPLPKPGGQPGEYVTYVPHPMPDNPGDWDEALVRLPQEAINTFDAWIAAGMPA